VTLAGDRNFVDISSNCTLVVHYGGTQWPRLNSKSAT